MLPPKKKKKDVQKVYMTQISPDKKTYESQNKNCTFQEFVPDNETKANKKSSYANYTISKERTRTTHTQNKNDLHEKCSPEQKICCLHNTQFRKTPPDQTYN